ERGDGAAAGEEEQALAREAVATLAHDPDDGLLLLRVLLLRVRLGDLLVDEPLAEQDRGRREEREREQLRLARQPVERVDRDERRGADRRPAEAREHQELRARVRRAPLDDP